MTDPLTKRLEDPSQHTSAYKLNTYYFTVLVPDAFANMERDAFLGTPKYQQLDNVSRLQRKTAQQARVLHEMLMWRKMGVPIEFVNTQDLVTVYRAVKDVLDEHMYHANTSFNHTYVPQELLTELDDFAQYLFIAARNYMDDINGAASNYIQKTERIEKRRGFKRRGIQHDEKPRDKPIPEHRSVADELAALVVQRKLTTDREEDDDE